MTNHTTSRRGRDPAPASQPSAILFACPRRGPGGIVHGGLALVLACATLPFAETVRGAGAHAPLSVGGAPTAKSSTPDPDPFAPTVSRPESLLLQRAVAAAETDPAAAADLLATETDADRSAAVDFAIGNFRFQANDFSAAETAYRDTVLKAPRFRNARANLGRLLLMLDRPREAQTVFVPLVRDGQADAETLRLVGHSLLMQDRSIAAEGAFRQALVLAPDNSETLRGLARSLLDQDRIPEVLSLTQELLSALPEDGELWVLRANACLARDQYDDAIVAIETAHALRQTTPELMATLGDLYLNQNQPGDAVRAYQEAFIGRTPDVNHLLRATDALLSLGATKEAAALLTQAQDAADRDTPETDRRLRHLVARLAILRGDPARAIELLTDLLRYHPLDGEAMIRLAGLQADQDAGPEAQLWLERAARIDGFEAQASVAHAEYLVRRGRYAEAVPLLETAQTYDPRSPVARYLEQVRRLAAGINPLAAR